MLVTQTILIGILYFISQMDGFFGTSLIGRAIIMGPLTGLIMGDVASGVMIGGTLELAFIGAVSIGAYDPPDVASVTILGTAFAIKAGAGPEVAIAMGLPVSTIMQTVIAIAWGLLPTLFMHRADAFAEKGDAKGVSRNMFVAGFAPIVAVFWIVPAAYYFGSDAVVNLLGNIPEFITTGMDIAAGIIPAIGFAMLAEMIMNKKVAPFFFLGFFLIQYFGIGTTAVAIFAVIIAIVIVQLSSNQPQTKQEEDGFDDF